jgi:serine/threonine protein kinase
MSKAKPAPLPSGTVVGGYTIVKKLAAGGFGVVYLAEGDNQTLVAIKEYLPASLAERSPGELTPRVKPDKQPLYRLGLEELLRRGTFARADQPPQRGQCAEFLPRERNRLHGDELPAG